MSLTHNQEAQTESTSASSNQSASDPELVQEFLIECREHLANIEAALLALERDPSASAELHSVFRSFHSIKGLAGFLGAPSIQELAHETEEVLDRARSRQIALTPKIIDLILHVADELAGRLDLAGSVALDRLPACRQSLIERLRSVVRGGVKHELEANPPSAREHGANSARASEGRLVRVETAKLEYLVDLADKLVNVERLVRNHAAIAQSEDPALSRNLAQLSRITQELQKASIWMRLVPVGTVFRKMSRLIRDLSRKSQKLVELITVGDDVELDRDMADDLADAMIHMIRNAVDHGLELPEERSAAGKPQTGRVTLQAMRDAGDIVIEISDDGRGLDFAKILSKAWQLGLVASNKIPDEDAVFRLIFEPGLSTAGKVTDLSGRGVGMDAVRTQIQKLRGKISIRSVAGQGCTFVLRLPLTRKTGGSVASPAIPDHLLFMSLVAPADSTGATEI